MTDTNAWPPELLVELRLATFARLLRELRGDTRLNSFDRALLAGRAMAGPSHWRRVENKLHLGELERDYTYVVN